MSVIANKWATLCYPVRPTTTRKAEDLPIKASEAIRKAITDAFAAFEPEAIGLEALAFETELTQVEIVETVAEMVARHEVLAHIEDFVFLRDGTESNHIAFPVNDDSSAICRSKTMYRINHEWKEAQ